MNRIRPFAIALLVLAALSVAGAAHGQGTQQAQADLQNADGQSVGTLTLTEGSGGVRLTGQLHDLPPGEHGFHLHAVGQCAAPDFTSAGGHFNPTGAQHGLNNPGGPHAGDLPNLTVGTDGTVNVDLTAERVTLASGANALLDSDGAALVIHEGPDDNVSDPAGNSGARIACGVITAAPAMLPTTGHSAQPVPGIVAAAGLLLLALALGWRRWQPWQ